MPQAPFTIASAAVAQRVFGKGKTPDTATELAVFLKRVVTQLNDDGATWVVECADVAVDRKVMASSLDKLRIAMEEEAPKHSEQKGDVSEQKTFRDNLGTRLRNARNGLRSLIEGLLTLLGDLDGEKHVALRHAAPTVGTTDTPPVPAPPPRRRPRPDRLGRGAPTGADLVGASSVKCQRNSSRSAGRRRA